MKRTVLFALLLLAAAALIGCGTNSTTSTASQSLQTTLDNQTGYFDFGASDAETTGGVTVLQTSGESYSWYRHFGSPANPTYTIVSQDSANALVKVVRSVEGTLYYHLTPGSMKRIKYFNQEVTRYAQLTSADSGKTWSLAQLSPAVAKSVKQTPTLGVGSVPCDVTISKVVLSSDGAVIAEVTVEASANGPWFDLSALPKVRRGSTLEVTVYAAATGGYKPLVYLWPSLKTVFRAPLNNESPAGVFAGTAGLLVVPSTETTGIKQLYVGVFNSGTLSDTTSPYDYGGWHLLYQVE
ncbi:MAG: hypothetical protein WC500_05500 [Candidatus Margulisiibacteriota bacterium]